jgi:hypothetical protein
MKILVLSINPPYPLVSACPDDYREGVASAGLQTDVFNSKILFLNYYLKDAEMSFPLDKGVRSLPRTPRRTGGFFKKSTHKKRLSFRESLLK